MNADSTVLVDTGPLVALFDPSDLDHEVCLTALDTLRRYRLLTNLAVLTEASHLLAFSVQAQSSLLEFVAAGAVEVADITTPQLLRAGELMRKYRDLPMDLADATLVVLAEQMGIGSVFTLDRRDFLTYRVGRRRLRLIPGA